MMICYVMWHADMQMALAGCLPKSLSYYTKDVP